MQLYEKIQYLRKINNLTQTQVADALYVSRQAVQKWENGTTSPDITKLPELAQLFSVLADVLLDNKITEEQLKQIVVSKSMVSKPEPAKQSEARRYSALDWLLCIPLYLGIFLIIGMAYVFGAMFIGFFFIASAGGVVAVVYGCIAVGINALHGAGAILVSLSIIFAGAGISYPMFVFAMWYTKKYKQFAIWMQKKIQEKYISWSGKV